MADRSARTRHGREAGEPHDGHEAHDPLLIAAWVAGDSHPGETARAAAQAAGCVPCRALADDLRVIQAATAAMPAPERTRDFRLTPADAAQLRSRRGWLAAFSPGAAGRLRPLAAAMTAIGLAGLFVTTLPISAPTSGSGAAVSRPAAEAGPTMMAAQASAAAAAPASAEAAASGAGPAAASGNDTQQVRESTVPRGGDPSAGLFGAGGGEPDAASPPSVDSAAPPAVAPTGDPDLLRPAVTAASLVLVVGGLALLLVTRREPRRVVRE